MRSGKVFPICLLIIITVGLGLISLLTEPHSEQVGLSVKYYLDQSSAQLRVLTDQLTYLRTRYGELTGLESSQTKTRHDTSQAGKCFPRKQVGQDVSSGSSSSLSRLPSLKLTRLGAPPSRTSSSGTETGTTSTSPCRRGPGCSPTNNLSMLPWSRDCPGPGWALTCSYSTGESSRSTLRLILSLSVWNYDEVHKILPDAVFITLLRNPVRCYESNYVYMGLQNIFKYFILANNSIECFSY